MQRNSNSFLLPNPMLENELRLNEANNQSFSSPNDFLSKYLQENIPKNYDPIYYDNKKLNMNAGIEAAKLIKGNEDLRLKAYMPTKNDVPTIGYGHTSGVKMGDTLKNEEEALSLFNKDTLDAVKAINNYVKIPLNQNQFDALVSLVFNIGSGNFQRSTLLKKINSKQFNEIDNHFLEWNKQRNKITGKMEVLNGLTKRRKKELELFSKKVEE